MLVSFSLFPLLAPPIHTAVYAPQSPPHRALGLQAAVPKRKEQAAALRAGIDAVRKTAFTSAISKSVEKELGKRKLDSKDVYVLLHYLSPACFFFLTCAENVAESQNDQNATNPVAF